MGLINYCLVLFIILFSGLNCLETETVINKQNIQKRPPPPAILDIFSVNNKIFIYWSSPSYAGYCPVTGYELYRKSDYFSYSLISKPERNSNYYVDTAIELNSVYSYCLRAMNGIYKSKFSNEVVIYPK